MQLSPSEIDFFDRETKTETEANLETDAAGKGCLEILSLNISLTPLVLEYAQALQADSKRAPLRQLMPNLPSTCLKLNKINVFIHSGKAATNSFHLENTLIDSKEEGRKSVVYLKRPVTVTVEDAFNFGELKTSLKALTLDGHRRGDVEISPVEFVIHDLDGKKREHVNLDLPGFLISPNQSIYSDLILKYLEFLADAIEATR